MFLTGDVDQNVLKASSSSFALEDPLVTTRSATFSAPAGGSSTEMSTVRCCGLHHRMISSNDRPSILGVWQSTTTKSNGDNSWYSVTCWYRISAFSTFAARMTTQPCISSKVVDRKSVV